MARPFSQRYGHVKVEEVIQVESLNKDSRMAIWNCIHEELLKYKRQTNDTIETIARRVWINFLKNDSSKVPIYSSSVGAPDLVGEIKRVIISAHWYYVYDFVEFIIDETRGTNFEDLSIYLNSVFKSEGLAYSIIDGMVVPVSTPLEVESIQEGINTGSDSSRKHFECALELLSNREQPDFRNSIKESISAIESLCKKISGNEKGTLGDCLKTIEDKGHIHPAMKRAFQQLYGYTSDQGGIRHALTDDSEEPTLEEARYMLVICSAFSNYLVSKMAD
ncbi:AbiJ-NTD4 domain-containing protein [Klebsiella pneumoniae]|uniref:AbiJ-NTD4 domain-containing protein n=1 Tax=Klebsiella pneumoniae TaxID=573 RepID=UPI002AC58007|nr:hypothetical protein [Klebsiella pneumoniae]HEN3808809.1 hypothetical protein [Klebsiella pneumoniae]